MGAIVESDLHVHTTFSDGAISLQDARAAALAKGLRLLGISDHFLTRKLGPERCLVIEQLPRYVESLRELATPSLAIWAGLEVDFSARRTNLALLDAAAPWEILDFVIFEYVGDSRNCGGSLEEFLEFRARIPCRVGLAHTDLSSVFAEMPARELARRLDAARIFVELCESSRRQKTITGNDGKPRNIPYFLDDSAYWREFFLAAREGTLRFSLGSDAHRQADDIGALTAAAAFLEKMELSDRLPRADDAAD